MTWCSSTSTRTTRASCNQCASWRGFQRGTLTPGQTKTVTLKLLRQNFGFYNDQGQFVVEPGLVHLWVGDSSVGGSAATFTLG